MGGLQKVLVKEYITNKIYSIYIQTSAHTTRTSPSICIKNISFSAVAPFLSIDEVKTTIKEKFGSIVRFIFCEELKKEEISRLYWEEKDDVNINLLRYYAHSSNPSDLIELAKIVIYFILSENPYVEENPYIKEKHDIHKNKSHIAQPYHKDRVDDLLESYWNECKSEISSLKEREFPNKISLLDLLSKDEDKLVNVFRSEELFNAISEPDFINNYPIFGSKIEENLKKGIVRNKYLIDSNIRNSSELGDVLKGLTEEECTVVCKTLKEKSPSFINNSSDFNAVLKRLNAEKCVTVCKVFKVQLLLSIRNSSELGNVLKDLTEKQCTVVCEALKRQLPSLINDASDFNAVLKCLNDEECVAKCTALKEQLLSIIKRSKLTTVLTCIDYSKQHFVIKALEGELPSLINDASDFKDVPNYLSTQKCTEVYQKLKEKLPSLINNISDYNDVRNYLSPEECTEISQKLEEKSSFFTLQISKLEDSEYCHSLSDLLTNKQSTMLREALSNEEITENKKLKEKIEELIIENSRLREENKPESQNLSCRF